MITSLALLLLSTLPLCSADSLTPPSAISLLDLDPFRDDLRGSDHALPTGEPAIGRTKALEDELARLCECIHRCSDSRLVNAGKLALFLGKIDAYRVGLPYHPTDDEKEALEIIEVRGESILRYWLSLENDSLLKPIIDRWEVWLDSLKWHGSSRKFFKTEIDKFILYIRAIIITIERLGSPLNIDLLHRVIEQLRAVHQIVESKNIPAARRLKEQGLI